MYCMVLENIITLLYMNTVRIYCILAMRQQPIFGENVYLTDVLFYMYNFEATLQNYYFKILGSLRFESYN